MVDVAARKGILKSSGKCFNCLRKGHISRTCKSLSRCRRCKGKHHTSICEADSEQVQPSSLATPSGSDLSPGAPPFRPNQTTTNICSSHSQVVFLQTARAVIQNPTNAGTSIEVRLLFDGGSQRSYLSERARDLLHLDACGEHSLHCHLWIAQEQQEGLSYCQCAFVSEGVSLHASLTVCCTLTL